MIIVITTTEINQYSRKKETIVSHGIDEFTGKTIIFPNCKPECIGAKFDFAIGEYVICDDSLMS